MPHPTDSHPPLSTRLDSLGVPISELFSEELNVSFSNKAIQLIDGAETIEEELSDLEHYALVKSGQVVLDNNDNKQEQKNKTDVTGS